MTTQIKFDGGWDCRQISDRTKETKVLLQDQDWLKFRNILRVEGENKQTSGTEKLSSSALHAVGCFALSNGLVESVTKRQVWLLLSALKELFDFPCARSLLLFAMCDRGWGMLLSSSGRIWMCCFWWWSTAKHSSDSVSGNWSKCNSSSGLSDSSHHT